MRSPARRTSTFALAALLVLAAATPSSAVHKKSVTRAVAFDGVWSVSILTQSGPCDPSYRYPARIWRGQVVQADNDFSYQLTGAVYNNGAISVTVSKGGQSATGVGRLSGKRGGGRWIAAGGQCAGVWVAMRR